MSSPMIPFIPPAASSASKGSGLFANQNPPHYFTGALYLPVGYAPNTSNSITTTINRCYYFPMPIWEAHTFQGAVIANTSAGDNGEKCRIMVFNDDGTTGPGTLAKDFGEITLDATAATRTLSSSWAATPGTYWLAAWFNSASDWSTMTANAVSTGVGGFGGPFIGSYIGILGGSPVPGVLMEAHYVDTAYGAAPASAVAPTATITKVPNAVTAVVPNVSLKG